MNGPGNDVAAFSGCWRRTLLFEPALAASPDPVGSGAIVFWLQAPNGLFVDVRRVPGHAEPSSPRAFKSFSGMGEAVTTAAGRCQFTWRRDLDYRPPGTPDVGDMVWLPDASQCGLLQEDGVLPGDDYREIWQRQEPPVSSALAVQCGVELAHRTVPGSRGCLVACGRFVGWALRVGPACAGAVQEHLRAYFAEGSTAPLSLADAAALHTYTSGLADAGTVVVASESSWTGRALADVPVPWSEWKVTTHLSPEEQAHVTAALGHRCDALFKK